MKCRVRKIKQSADVIGVKVGDDNVTDFIRRNAARSKLRGDVTAFSQLNRRYEAIKFCWEALGLGEKTLGVAGFKNDGAELRVLDQREH